MGVERHTNLIDGSALYDNNGLASVFTIAAVAIAGTATGLEADPVLNSEIISTATVMAMKGGDETHSYKRMA